MAFTAPTAADLKARFPAFVDVADATVTAAIALAVEVAVDDETWLSQAQYTEGALLYTAHTLTLDGFGTSAEADIAAEGLLNARRLKSGSLEIERRSGASSGAFDVSSTTLASTSYGQRYLQLLKINQPAAQVLNGAA